MHGLLAWYILAAMDGSPADFSPTTRQCLGDFISVVRYFTLGYFRVLCAVLQALRPRSLSPLVAAASSANHRRDSSILYVYDSYVSFIPCLVSGSKLPEALLALTIYQF